MKVSGLSNQWQSRDGLVLRFAQIDPETEFSNLPEWGKMFLLLLEELESLDGPDLFIGTSLGEMNFNLRDTIRQSDRVPSFALVQIVDDKKSGKMYYQFPNRQVLQHRPTNEWKKATTAHASVVAKAIRNAADYAEVPVRQIKKGNP